jgi:uncharacterized membrane protein YagU involved in acid resistance
MDEETPELRRPMLMGAIAGLAATAPMTAAMLYLHRRLPLQERQPLPQRGIIDNLTRRFHQEERLTESEEMALSFASHFAYGAAMGGIYSFIYRRLRLPAPVSGVFYGLALWVTSYLGWLPSARILPPATEETPARNFLMIFAHVVWGVSLDLTLGLFRKPRGLRRRRLAGNPV